MSRLVARGPGRDPPCLPLAADTAYSSSVCRRPRLSPGRLPSLLPTLVLLLCALLGEAAGDSLGIKHVTYRIAEVTAAPPPLPALPGTASALAAAASAAAAAASAGLGAGPKLSAAAALALSPTAAQEEYEVALIDVFFDAPAFFRGVPLPDLTEFLSTSHDAHRILGDTVRLSCPLSHPSSAANATASSASTPTGAGQVMTTTMSTDPQSPAHTAPRKHYLLPLAAAPTTRFPWLRPLAALAAHQHPHARAYPLGQTRTSTRTSTSASTAGRHGSGGGSSGGGSSGHAGAAVPWSRITFAALLTRTPLGSDPSSVYSSHKGSGSSSSGGSSSGYGSKEVIVDVAALERGDCTLEFPTPSTATSPPPTAAATAAGGARGSTRVTSRAPASTFTTRNGAPLAFTPPYKLRGGHPSLRRRRISPAAVAAAAAEDAAAAAGAAAGAGGSGGSGSGSGATSFFQAAAAVTTGTGAGTGLMAMSSVGVPFLSTLLAPITSFIQEGTVRRVPEFVKFRFKTDFSKSIVQATVSSEAFGGQEGNDAVAEPVNALIELRSRATAEMTGENARFSRKRPQKTTTGYGIRGDLSLFAAPGATEEQRRAQRRSGGMDESEMERMWDAAIALRDGMRKGYGSLLEMGAATGAGARAGAGTGAGVKAGTWARSRARGGLWSSFPKIDDSPGPMPSGEMLGAWTAPGAPKGGDGDRTHMTPDGCLTQALASTIITTLTNLVTIGVTQSLVANTKDTLTSEISPSEIEQVVPALSEALPRALIPMAAAALGHSVPGVVARLVPPLVTRHTTAALTDTVTRGLVHVLAPTLSHTLRDAGRIEPLCYYCRHVDPRYCYLCPADRPMPESAQGALDLHTVDFFGSYYSDYFADYYNGRVPLASAYKEWRFHPGGPEPPKQPAR